MTYQFRIYDFWGEKQPDKIAVYANTIERGMEDVAEHLVRFDLLTVDKMGNTNEIYLIKAYQGRKLTGEYYLQRTGKYWVQYFRKQAGRKAVKHNIKLRYA